VHSVAPERVFHLGAAAMHAGRSPDAAELVATNLGGTVTLLDACRELSVEAFVNVGDAFEYGPGSGALSEATPCRPTSLDGITKLAASLYGTALARTAGLPVVSVRPFSIVGRDDDPRRLVPRLVATARSGERIALSDPRVVGGGGGRDGRGARPPPPPPPPARGGGASRALLSRPPPPPPCLPWLGGRVFRPPPRGGGGGPPGGGRGQV
jgi:nucleoside-diphosphate-sugar epimerase